MKTALSGNLVAVTAVSSGSRGASVSSRRRHNDVTRCRFPALNSAHRYALRTNRPMFPRTADRGHALMSAMKAVVRFNGRLFCGTVFDEFREQNRAKAVCGRLRMKFAGDPSRLILLN